MENRTDVTEIVLSALSEDPRVQIMFFVLFLAIYTLTLLGNTIIIVVIKVDPRLYTPMYIFLCNLSFIDIIYSTAIVPKMLANLLTQESISLQGCLAQMFFILLSAGAEIFTLSAMAYDRYAAICDPLHYNNTMSKKICIHLTTGAWLMGILYASVNTVLALHLHFCGSNEIGHFSCELPPLLKLSCSDTFLNDVALLSSAVIMGFGSFIPILVSYICIVSAILKIQTTERRHKAFSTCSSHLTVVILLYVTASFQYMKPSSVSSTTVDQLLAIQYSIMTPMLNPIIYSLKSREVKASLTRMAGKIQISPKIVHIPKLCV
ncbi:olfactory receptor 1019-like [Hemicordylus capensis]|uniref:olfactory receptor 1019-like n=1 Tax=Hemicordylus capensis TaxID=884348 RepID=UPI0023023598|nr:olfactory receptor 1019-like [Hemicordylus capensis]